MTVEVSKRRNLHRKMLPYLLGSIAMIVAATIVSLALYLVLPDYLFPFAALPVFAVLVFLLTLVLKDAYYDRTEMGQKVAAGEVND
jgi:hypothetical protein